MSSTEAVIENAIILTELRIGNAVLDNMTKKVKWVDSAFFASKHNDDRYCFLNTSKESLQAIGFQECTKGVFVHPRPGLHFRVCDTQRKGWVLHIGPVGNELVSRNVKNIHTIQNIFLDIYETDSTE